MFGLIKKLLRSRRERKMERRAQKSVEAAIQALRDRRRQYARVVMEERERDPKHLLLRTGLPASWFTQRRTPARAKAYRKAFYSLSPAKRKLVAARYGDPS